MKRFNHFQLFTSFNHLRTTKSTVILLFIFSCTFLKAQVRTTILEKEQSISTLMPGYTPDQPDAKILPKVDVRKVLEEDKKRGSQLPRFGVKIPVGYAVQDGQWYDQGRTSIWKMKFYSRHATALSFQFTDLHLPDGSEM